MIRPRGPGDTGRFINLENDHERQQTEGTARADGPQQEARHSGSREQALNDGPEWTPATYRQNAHHGRSVSAGSTACLRSSLSRLQRATAASA